MPRSAIGEIRNAYSTQRSDARRRGIPFLLSFEEWLDVWQRSGKLALRGNKHGQYVMSRPNDQGPYSVSNVRIVLCSENNSEAHLGKRKSIEMRARLSAAKLGRSNGPFSAQARANMSRAHIGLRHTAASRAKMSLIHKGRPRNDDGRFI